MVPLTVRDCVEMYQNGQDENAAFFWHQICCSSHRRDSQPPVITRDTKKTDKKAKFLSGCPRRKSPLFTLPVFMQFQVTADTYGSFAIFGPLEGGRPRSRDGTRWSLPNVRVRLTPWQPML